jgi:hypothetical protein
MTQQRTDITRHRPDEPYEDPLLDRSGTHSLMAEMCAIVIVVLLCYLIGYLVLAGLRYLRIELLGG